MTYNETQLEKVRNRKTEVRAEISCLLDELESLSVQWHHHTELVLREASLK